MQYDKERFIEEWESGKYEKISDCPSYSTVKAYCEAVNILIREHYPKNRASIYTITPRGFIEEIQ